MAVAGSRAATARSPGATPTTSTTGATSGLTELDNLVLLCNRHHHQIHRPGWHLKLLPNADLEITYPDGTTRTSQPRGQPTPTRPMSPKLGNK